MADGDPDTELIENEIDWARFIKMILLELRAQKPLPNIESYWTKKGFDLKKRPISLTLQVLHNFVDVVTLEEKECYVDKSKNKIREEKEEDKEKSKSYSGFEETTISLWNSFCDKNPTFSKIKEVSDKRRAFLKKRFEKESFRDFNKILSAVLEQPFLKGENDRKWKLNFDWLIENDNNYLKVLELRYKDKITKDMKGADPDCQTCAGTGWDEQDGFKKLCHCRIVR